MKKKIPFALVLATAPISFAQVVQTPEQRADPSTGQIPNQSVQEYYYGSIGLGQSDTEGIIGAIYPNQPSAAWYKFTSDGTSPVILDMFGSNMGFGGGGLFGASNFGEIAVYNSQGGLVADSKDGFTPSTGDTNVPIVVPDGAPAPPPTYSIHQPLDPTQPSASYSASEGRYFQNNAQALATLAFVNNPQSNPLWNPSNPNYDPTSNWNQYPVLPAGNYFVLVVGYSTYFSGDAADATSMNTYGPDYPISPGVYPSSTTPFSFVDFSAMGGTYELNVRLAGDFNHSGTINSTDVSLLRNQIAGYLPNGGIPTGVSGWTPSMGLNGLPDNIRQFDLSGNCRIDQNDLSLWGNYTNLSTSLSITWNNTGGWGDGATWDVQTSENFTNSTGLDLFYNGDTVTFNDSNNGHYAVTLNATVAPAAVVVNNSAGNYVFSGTGGISGSTALSKSGSGKLTLNTVNSYTGGTNVSAGTFVVGASGALPAGGAVTISGGTIQLGSSTGLQTISSLSITGSGAFDINNNHVLIDYGSGADPISSIAALIKAGYANGTWTGIGINSSAAAANAGVYGIGYADAADPGNPAQLASGTIEIKYTLLGDADLNGIVNGIDFGIVAANFNKGVTSWDQGDFDYSGVVNGIDFGDLAANFNKGASGAAAWNELVQFAQANGFMADVPEPGTLIPLAAISAGALFSRRFKRKP